MFFVHVGEYSSIEVFSILSIALITFSISFNNNWLFASCVTLYILYIYILLLVTFCVEISFYHRLLKE